jgi:pimeloyl-ACP methyl ester carboxylesterase
MNKNGYIPVLLCTFLLISGAFLILHSQVAQTQPVTYGSNSLAGHYAPVKGATLYYEIYGQGSPVLFIHGGYRSMIDFEKNIPVIAKHFMVIAVDSRGFGRSTNLMDSMSYELLTDDMNQLLTYLKLDSVAVCGFSDGGIVALYLAARYPLRITKVFASGANYLANGGLPVSAITPLDAQKINASPFWSSIRDHYVKLNPNPEKFYKHVQLIRKMWAHNPCIPKNNFIRIKAPVLLLYGDRDLIPLEHGLEMFRLLPRRTSQLCILPNTTHFTFSENAKLVNELLISFL